VANAKTSKKRHRPRRPDLDEKFSLPEDTDPDEVLRRLIGTEDTSDEWVNEDEDPHGPR
jgi:hypothetical protein